MTIRNFLVREYEPDTPGDWADATRIAGGDAHDAAESYARMQCARDSERLSSYESGKFLEVRQVGANVSVLVTVWVNMQPHFNSRLDHTLSFEPEKTQ